MVSGVVRAACDLADVLASAAEIIVTSRVASVLLCLNCMLSHSLLCICVSVSALEWLTYSCRYCKYVCLTPADLCQPNEYYVAVTGECVSECPCGTLANSTRHCIEGNL